MKLVVKYIREAFYSLYANISGRKMREFQKDDELSKDLLRQYVIACNGKRLLLFSLVTAIVGLILLITAFIGCNSEAAVPCLLRILGYLMITVLSVLIFMLLAGELKKRISRWNRLTLLIRTFWGAFVIGIFLLTTSDLMLGRFSFVFFLMLLITVAIPLFTPKESACFSGGFMLLTLISAAIAGIDFQTLMLYCVFIVAFYLLSVITYNSFCCLWISERQFNTVNERCRQITEKDALTGLLNKKGLIKRLDDILENGVFNSIAAIFIDIDDFKRYNQIFTDKESDDCLYNICNCVRIISKTQTDIISRFGGDEFVVVLENISEYELISFAEQIRQSIETMALPFEDGKVVTITVGVSSIKTNELKEYSELLSEAKSALQIAKNSGKNCVGYKDRAFKRT